MNKAIKNTILTIIGSIIYSLGINLFIIPSDFYSAGFSGISQLMSDFINVVIEFSHPINLTGPLVFILNIPMIIVAYKDMSKSFCIKTIISISVITIALSFIPVPSSLIIDDMLAAALIGGLMTGAGAGFVLRAGASAGGTDILGVFLTKRSKNFSIGKLTLIINVVLILFIFIFNEGNLTTVIYTIIYMAIYSVAIDSVHTQNISVTATIITKNDDLGKYITNTTGRGVNKLIGVGCYTNEPINYLVTVISKYEISSLKTLVAEKDPTAFVIINNNDTILGNYEKRLEA